MTGEVPTGRRGRRSTPDAGGYLIAVLVSVLVVAAGLVLSGGALTSLSQTVASVVVVSGIVGVVAVPVAPVGVLAVHLCCRRVRAQWVHVAAAGLAGLVAGAVFGLVVAGVPGLLDGGLLSLLIGAGTAIGRAAVIPLRPLVPEVTVPVDDDFRPGRAAR